MRFASRIVQKAKTAWRLPFREKVWFLIAFPMSGVVRAAILVLPFRLFARYLGVSIQGRELSPLVSESDLQRARRIGAICRLAASYTPWESKCLVQAIVTRSWLGFYGIPYVIHLGVMKSEDVKEPFKAHAWVKVGCWAVSGGKGHQAFSVLGTYVSPRLLEAQKSPSCGERVET